MQSCLDKCKSLKKKECAQDALADLETLDALDSQNMKAAVLRKKLSRTAVQGKESESAVCARMFDNSLQPC